VGGDWYLFCLLEIFLDKRIGINIIHGQLSAADYLIPQKELIKEFHSEIIPFKEYTATHN